jgi:hypothetical protein
MELFVNQSAVTIENKDFGTILVSLFIPERGISPPSSSHRLHDDPHRHDFISHHDV